MLLIFSSFFTLTSELVIGFLFETLAFALLVYISTEYATTAIQVCGKLGLIFSLFDPRNLFPGLNLNNLFPGLKRHFNTQLNRLSNDTEYEKMDRLAIKDDTEEMDKSSTQDSNENDMNGLGMQDSDEYNAEEQISDPQQHNRPREYDYRQQYRVNHPSEDDLHFSSPYDNELGGYFEDNECNQQNETLKTDQQCHQQEKEKINPENIQEKKKESHNELHVGNIDNLFCLSQEKLSSRKTSHQQNKTLKTATADQQREENLCHTQEKKRKCHNEFHSEKRGLRLLYSTPERPSSHEKSNTTPQDIDDKEDSLSLPTLCNQFPSENSLNLNIYPLETTKQHTYVLLIRTVRTQLLEPRLESDYDFSCEQLKANQILKELARKWKAEVSQIEIMRTKLEKIMRENNRIQEENNRLQEENNRIIEENNRLRKNFKENNYSEKLETLREQARRDNEQSQALKQSVLHLTEDLKEMSEKVDKKNRENRRSTGSTYNIPRTPTILIHETEHIQKFRTDCVRCDIKKQLKEKITRDPTLHLEQKKMKSILPKHVASVHMYGELEEALNTTL